MHKYEIIIAFILINTVAFFVYRHVDPAAAASTAIPRADEPVMRVSPPSVATDPMVTPIAPAVTPTAPAVTPTGPDVAIGSTEATKPALVTKAKPTAKRNKGRRPATAGTKSSPPSADTAAKEPADDMMTMEANPYKRGE